MNKSKPERSRETEKAGEPHQVQIPEDASPAVKKAMERFNKKMREHAEPLAEPKLEELPVLMDRCEYCGTLATDHKHGNGHRCCGDCCATHGGMAHNSPEEYKFVRKMVDYKNELLAELVALRGERDRLLIGVGKEIGIQCMDLDALIDEVGCAVDSDKSQRTEFEAKIATLEDQLASREELIPWKAATAIAETLYRDDDNRWNRCVSQYRDAIKRLVFPTSTPVSPSDDKEQS